MCINKSVLEGNESQRRKSDKPKEERRTKIKGKKEMNRARLRMKVIE
jgi:hypothetical protein